MQKIKGLIKNIWPLLFIGLIAWFSYSIWLNQMPKKTILSNSIEAKDVNVSSKVSGRIKNVFIEEGDTVKKGQKLLELEGDEFVARLEQARAAFKKSGWELNDLKKGARPQEIKQAEANTLKIKALLDEAWKKHEQASNDYTRMKSLYEEGAISKQSYEEYELKNDTTQKETENYEQEYAKAIENESLIKEGPRIDTIKALEAEVELNAARIKELEKYVRELTIEAPFDGVISSFDLRPGEVVSANEPLAVVTDLSDIYVRVYLPENKLSKIKVKQKLKIAADGFPGELFDGHITYISAKAEFTPRNVQTAEERTKLVYPVKIQITNKEDKLRDGMYITVKI